jgi:uncharacterized membrane protein (UPF0127 family)
VRAARAGLLALCAAFAPACHREPTPALPAPLPAFTSADIRIVSAADTFHLQVEIAETPRQRRLGLSRRTELRDDAGMLFLFEEQQPRGTAFWMYHTRVPLSIAFLDEDRVIREVRDMSPCRSPLSPFCPTYAASVPFRAALEVKRGYFTSRGIRVGDRVVLHRAPPE